MHADAFHIDDQIVQMLIDEQLPDLSALVLRRLQSNGSDNVIYRLGADKCVRLPITPRASAMLIKEVECIPKLPGLPLEIPMPLFTGKPVTAYQSPWAIYRWIEGEPVSDHPIQDEMDAAEKLATFVSALRRADASDAPLYGKHNNFRGCPLRLRHKPTVAAIENVADLYSVSDLQSVWKQSLNLKEWSHGPVWVHGDIHAANLLTSEGKLSAVIDFGLMGAGDPAVDLIVNWSLLGESARSHFRSVFDIDEDTWMRGRGWALSTALIALAYYRDKHRYLSEMSNRVIREVLNDTNLPPA